ncbi:hypothetical protein, partial [Bacillus mycoides]|uniref:hypothetical protein n=1 Tax=Bacillus mycoides TaxID=1405 RepID=UPI003A80FB28
MLLAIIFAAVVVIFGIWRERYFFDVDGKLWRIPMFWVVLVGLGFSMLHEVTGVTIKDMNKGWDSVHFGIEAGVWRTPIL